MYSLNKKENFQLVVIPSMRTPKNTIEYAKEYFGENHTVIDKVDKKAYLRLLLYLNLLLLHVTQAQ